MLSQKKVRHVQTRSDTFTHVRTEDTFRHVQTRSDTLGRNTRSDTLRHVQTRSDTLPGGHLQTRSDTLGRRTASDTFRHVRPEDSFRHVQTRSDTFRHVRTEDTFRHVQTRSDTLRHTQTLLTLTTESHTSRTSTVHHCRHPAFQPVPRVLAQGGQEAPRTAAVAADYDGLHLSDHACDPTPR